MASYTAPPAPIQPGIESLMMYTQVFAYIGGVTLISSVAMWLLAPYLSHYISQPNPDET